MNPQIWGSHMWFSLHSITFNYPINPTQEIKERIRNFFNSLEYILPCELCRVHYSQHIRKHPIEFNLDNRRKLVYWLIDVHNLVNRMLGKQVMSHEHVLTLYSKIYGKAIELDKQDDKCSSTDKCSSVDGFIDGSGNTTNTLLVSTCGSVSSMFKNPLFYIVLFMLICMLCYIFVLNKK